MADIKLSNAVGSAGLPKLAPNLTYPGGRAGMSAPYTQITGIDVSGGVLQTVLSLTGKFSVSLLQFEQIAASENVSVRLTIDGVVIWDDSYSLVGSSDTLINSRAANISETSYLVSDSLLLEYATDTDTSITFNYLVRPIL